MAASHPASPPVDTLAKRFVIHDSHATETDCALPAVEPEQTQWLRRIDQLLEVLPAGVIIIDGQGVVQQYNHAAATMLGQPLQKQQWTRIIERAFAPKSGNSTDVALNTGRLVHISTKPLYDEPGQLVLLNDVTETRQLQMKVSHLQRLSAMGEMTARLAHQIRTPLSSAVLYLSPLLKADTTAELRQQFAHKLQRSLTHMTGLIQDMLAFSRGDMKEAKPVAVADLCDTLVQQFRPQPCEFIVNNHADKGMLYGHHDALSSAIQNLLDNAKLACEGRQGKIRLTVQTIIKQDKPWVEIQVADNGMGIACEHQSQLFTPFFTTRSSGTGLGLAVVHSIITAHRGVILFDSQLDKGSTFILQLPHYATT